MNGIGELTFRPVALSVKFVDRSKIILFNMIKFLIRVCA
jgi:hypothetical protein